MRTDADDFEHALELALTGDVIDAETAERWGLVNRVVADEELDAAVADLVRRIVRSSPLARAMGKQVLHSQMDLPIDAAYDLAIEAMAANGQMKLFKTVKAENLWRKMLGMLFETGHPWITFKDPCNIRYTNQHAGIVHSSNLCTEITLHTNDTEIAVCNLGSVNLAAHVTKDGLDMAKVEKTVATAMRMLDNVIDYNYYSVPQARASNLRHRPVGLGIMGFQDALYIQRIPYGSQGAMDFADQSMEFISYNAILGGISGAYA